MFVDDCTCHSSSSSSSSSLVVVPLSPLRVTPPQEVSLNRHHDDLLTPPLRPGACVCSCHPPPTRKRGKERREHIYLLGPAKATANGERRRETMEARSFKAGSHDVKKHGLAISGHRGSLLIIQYKSAENKYMSCQYDSPLFLPRRALRHA